MGFVRTDDQHYKAIAQAIRDKTPDDNQKQYKPEEMAEGISAVFNNGVKNGEAEGYNYGFNDGVAQGESVGEQIANDAFWDTIQDFGNRTDYNRAFKGWNCEYIRPKHRVIPTMNVGAICTFQNNTSLKKLEADYFDFSRKPSHTNSASAYYYTFQGCDALEEIEDIGIYPDAGLSNTFANNKKLHTIAKITVDENETFNAAFNGCSSLVNITFEGVIGKSIGFPHSPLSVASAKSVISRLKNFAGTDDEYVNKLTFTGDVWVALDADSAPPSGGSWKDYVSSLGWSY